MSYDTYRQTSVNPPRRNTYDSFQDKRGSRNFEEIELGTTDGGAAATRNDENRAFGGSFSLMEVRRNFIKKVYAIVGLELLLVTSIMALFMFSPLRDKVYKNKTWLIICYVIFGIMFVLELILVCCPAEKVLRKWPLNISLLTALAVGYGIILGITSAYYTLESIMIAVGITTATVLVVSIFAFFTKIDFTRCYGFLFILFILLLIFGIAFMFVFFLADDYTIYVMKMIYGALGAFVMVLCLIIDTQMMLIGKHKYSFSPEDYLLAALSIFMDIVTLFMYILFLVGGER